MSKEHIIYNFLINNRGLIHQRVNFSPGSTFLDPLEQEDEAIDRTEKYIYVKYFSHVVATSTRRCRKQKVLTEMNLTDILDLHLIHQTDLPRLPDYIPLTLALKIIDFLYLDTFDTYHTHTHTQRNVLSFTRPRTPNRCVGHLHRSTARRLELLTKIFHQ